MLQEAIADTDATAEAHARWLTGRVYEARGMPDAAIDAYGAALAYARDNADSDVLTQAGTALANLLLEAGDTAAAKRLLDELRPYAAHDHEFLRLDARHAVADGNPQRASAILSDLRQRAGEAWNQDDDELLRRTSAQ
jgi:tetratricopeptide (TPR) repeat protein